jgi:hypothetical protein
MNDIIERYKDLINAVIKRTYDDLHDAYLAYYHADIQSRGNLSDIESDIRYLEGWIRDTVQEWTEVSGDYLIRKCREQVEEELEGYARRKSYCKRIFQRIDSGKGTCSEGH